MGWDLVTHLQNGSKVKYIQACYGVRPHSHPLVPFGLSSYTPGCGSVGYPHNGAPWELRLLRGLLGNWWNCLYSSTVCVSVTGFVFFVIQRRLPSTRDHLSLPRRRGTKWCKLSSGWMRLLQELPTYPRWKPWTSITVTSVCTAVSVLGALSGLGALYS